MLFIEKIVDELPDGLDYIEGSTEIWVVTPAGTQYGTPDPDQDGTTLTWDLSGTGMMLFPCWWIYLEFEAEVLNCEAPYGHINEAEIVSWYGDLKVNDTDNATVWGVCEEPD